MQVAIIIELEKANLNYIYLLKEGLFYRAYNRSAMRVLRYFKPFKINRRYVKKVQQTIFYVGFPAVSLEAILQQAKSKGWQINEQDKASACADEIICITGLFDSTENYGEWERDLLEAEQEKIVEADTMQTRGFDIIKQIESFQIENATPMDAILFVNKLKQQIRNGNV